MAKASGKPKTKNKKQPKPVIDYLFNPATVAVIGASRNPKKIGHVIFRNSIEGRFKGTVYPVNPEAQEILERKCYPSIGKIGKPIDMAIITVPAPLVPGILMECKGAGVKAAVIISGGFKEVGRTDLDEKLQEAAKKSGIRVLGPNCIGIYDAYSGIDTIFNPRYKMGRPEKGAISFISQSGATVCIIMDWMAHKGYRGSKFISYGNALNTDEADLIEYLVRDKATKVICVYMEGIKNGRKFFEIARDNSKRIPIIALKGGVSDAAVKAVSTHTGSLAGAPEIYRAMFKQAGVIEADDLEQVFDFARVLSTQPMPRGKKVQIITNGGGFGVLMTDYIAKNGLELAPVNDARYADLKKMISDHVVIRNPLDLTGDTNAEMYIEAIKVAKADPNVDMIAVILLLQLPTLSADIVEMVADECRNCTKPVIIVSAGGDYTEVLKKSMEDYGIPCFSYPERAAMAMKALCDYSNFRSAGK